MNIHVFHSDDNPVIPLVMAQQLHALKPGKIDLTIVIRAGHDALTKMEIKHIYQRMQQMWE